MADGRHSPASKQARSSPITVESIIQAAHRARTGRTTATIDNAASTLRHPPIRVRTGVDSRETSTGMSALGTSSTAMSGHARTSSGSRIRRDPGATRVSPRALSAGDRHSDAGWDLWSQASKPSHRRNRTRSSGNSDDPGCAGPSSVGSDSVWPCSPRVNSCWRVGYSPPNGGGSAMARQRHVGDECRSRPPTTSNRRSTS